MASSFLTTNVGRYHVDTAVPEFIADLVFGVLNEVSVSVKLVTTATVDGRRMMGDLFVAFARICCPQFVEAFEVVLMEYVPCRADNPLLEIEVAFVRCQQVAATVWRDLFGVPERFANMLIQRGAVAPLRPPLVPSWISILP